MSSIVQRYTIYFKNFRKYYFLLTLLVKKEVKSKYKGSFLGILWSFFNPLLNMIVLSIVFSTLFKHDIENYPVYLLSGMLIFSFFSGSTTVSMKSIINAEGLIKKIYVPKYIITVSKIVSNFIFFLISVPVLIIIMIFTRSEMTLNMLYAPIYIVLLLFFCCGISLILATMTVFFKDLEHIYGVLISALMYASAIFYPPDIIPEQLSFIIDFNPMHYFIEGFRGAVYYHSAFDIKNAIVCATLAVISMVIGIIVFEKNQHKFIYHI